MLGRLTKDPETRYTQTNIAVTNFTIAVDRRFKKDNDVNVDFFDCVAWRTTGEFVGKYFTKGKPIAICGSLQNRSWEGEDGKKNYKTEIIVDEANFTGDKKTQEQETEEADDREFETVETKDDLPF